MDRAYRYDLRAADPPRDLSRMVEIERSCFPQELAYTRDDLSRLLRAKNARSFVAVERQTARTAGFVVVSWRAGSRTGSVQTLDVDPSEQGNGLGRLLLDAGERVMAERGLTRSVLQVYLRNNTALVLYLKSGYTVSRIRPGYYRNAYRGARHAVELLKTLAPLPPTRLSIPETVAEKAPLHTFTHPPGLVTPLPPAPAVPLTSDLVGAV